MASICTYHRCHYSPHSRNSKSFFTELIEALESVDAFMPSSCADGSRVAEEHRNISNQTMADSGGFLSSIFRHAGYVGGDLAHPLSPPRSQPSDYKFFQHGPRVFASLYIFRVPTLRFGARTAYQNKLSRHCGGNSTLTLQLTVPGTATRCIDTWRRRAVSARNIENIGQGRAGGR